MSLTVAKPGQHAAVHRTNRQSSGRNDVSDTLIHSNAVDAMAMKTKAVFLDKDGTLIENHPFDRAPEHIAWIPGVTEGLQLLHRWGYALIVVTNQGGIAQGRFTIEEVLHE